MAEVAERPPSSERMHNAARALIQGLGWGLKKVAERSPRGEYALWSLFVGLSCIFLWSAFSGPQGVIELLKLKGSLKRLKMQNEVLLQRNQTLEKEVYLLRNSRSYLEKVAREEYGYAYEGEKVYILSDGEPAAGAEVAGKEIGENHIPPR